MRGSSPARRAFSAQKRMPGVKRHRRVKQQQPARKGEGKEEAQVKASERQRGAQAVVPPPVSSQPRQVRRERCCGNGGAAARPPQARRPILPGRSFRQSKSKLIERAMIRYVAAPTAQRRREQGGGRKRRAADGGREQRRGERRRDVQPRAAPRRLQAGVRPLRPAARAARATSAARVCAAPRWCQRRSYAPPPRRVQENAPKRICFKTPHLQVRGAGANAASSYMRSVPTIQPARKTQRPPPAQPAVLRSVPAHIPVRIRHFMLVVVTRGRGRKSRGEAEKRMNKGRESGAAKGSQQRWSTKQRCAQQRAVLPSLVS